MKKNYQPNEWLYISTKTLVTKCYKSKKDTQCEDITSINFILGGWGGGGGIMHRLKKKKKPSYNIKSYL